MLQTLQVTHQVPESSELSIMWRRFRNNLTTRYKATVSTITTEIRTIEIGNDIFTRVHYNSVKVMVLDGERVHDIMFK